MVDTYKEGQEISFNRDRRLTVVKCLGRGGQGVVYEVDYKQKRYALKVLHRPRTKEEYDRQMALRSALQGDASWEGLLKLKLDRRFIIPRRMLVLGEDRSQLAYMMSLRTPDFVELGDLLSDRVRIPSGVSSLAVLSRFCFEVADCFSILHERNLIFRDLNLGSLALCLKTGRVRICDTDQIAPLGADGLEMAYPDILPPEVLRGDAPLSIQSDLHALAVVFFRVWCRVHPLQGKRTLSPLPLSDQQRLELLADHPLFCFHPHDQRNALIPGRHARQIKNWERLPFHLRHLFTHAFTEGLYDPSRRLSARAWRSCFLELRDQLIPCDCGALNFNTLSTCLRCTAQLTLGKRIVLPEPGDQERWVAWGAQMMLTHAHFSSVASSQRIGVPERLERQFGESEWALKNNSDSHWQVTSSRGERRTVGPNELLYFREGLQVTCLRPKFSFTLRA